MAKIIQDADSTRLILNRKVQGKGTTLVIAESQDLNEGWHARGRGARGAAVLDISSGTMSSADLKYLATRMLPQDQRGTVELLPDGVVRIPCKHIDEASLRAGKIREFVGTSENYTQPKAVVHLLDESQWAAADLCRATGSGHSTSGLTMVGLHIPEGDSVVIEELKEGDRVVGLILSLGSAEMGGDRLSEDGDEENTAGKDAALAAGE